MAPSSKKAAIGIGLVAAGAAAFAWPAGRLAAGLSDLLFAAMGTDPAPSSKTLLLYAAGSFPGFATLVVGAVVLLRR